jgi:hypothetical protein
MSLKINWLCIFFCSSMSVFAQKYLKNTLYLGKNNAIVNEYSIGFERKITPRSGFVFQFSYAQHNRTPTGFFNGDIVNKYISQRIEERFLITGLKRLVYDWKQIDGDPAFVKRDPYFPIDSYVGKLSYRSTFQLASSLFRLSLMPSVQFIRHQFFEIRDSRVNSDIFTDIKTLGTYPYEKELTTSTLLVEETRKIRHKYDNIFGFSYDMAFGIVLTNQFLFEIRGSLGLNYGQSYKDELPAAYRPFSTGFGVFLGYSF